MTEVSGLRDKIQQVIEAAIAAEMADHGFHGSCSKGFIGPGNASEADPLPPNVWVSYPTGRVAHEIDHDRPTHHEPVAPAVEIFDKWRREIPQNFDRFNHVPDPDGFKGALDTLAGIANGLAAGGATLTGSGKNAQVAAGNIDLTNLVSDLQKEVATYNGRAMEALDDSYISRLDEVLGGQHVLASLLGIMVAGEQQIWTDIRSQLLVVAENARRAFQAHADGGTNPVSPIKIATSLSTVLGLFTVHPAFKIGSVAVSLLSTWLTPPTPPAPLTLGGANVNEIHGKLVFALSELASGITLQENALADCAQRGIWRIDHEPAYYDLSTPSEFLGARRNEYFTGEEGPFLRTEGLRARAGTVQKIAGIVNQISGSLAGTLDRSAWERNPAIGNGADGCFPAYKELHGDLSNLLARAFRALGEVAERMVLVSHDFDRTEGQIEEDLRRYARQVNDPSKGQEVPYGY